MSVVMKTSCCIHFGACLRLNRCFSAGTVLAARAKTFFDDPGAPKVAVCKDGQTIAMYHPPKSLCYDQTMAIPRDDPRYSAYDNLNDLVRHKLEESGAADRSVQAPHIDYGWPLYDRELAPTVMELSNMFYKYKWESFYHRGVKGRKKNPPVNRPTE